MEGVAGAVVGSRVMSKPCPIVLDRANSAVVPVDLVPCVTVLEAVMQRICGVLSSRERGPARGSWFTRVVYVVRSVRDP